MNIHRAYALLGQRFRSRRMELFKRSFAMSAQTGIVDLGGAAETWGHCNGNARVTIVNVDPKCMQGDHLCVVADALSCPFPDRSFDIVFSNSLIEHLSTEQRQRAFADEVRRLARSGFFVQTPNKWFPIEPHYLAPFVQFVPERIRPTIVRWMTPWGWLTKPPRQRCVKVCQEIRLLDAQKMQQLFPDAEIVRERFLGITKSVIAIWRADAPPQAK